MASLFDPPEMYLKPSEELKASIFRITSHHARQFLFRLNRNKGYFCPLLKLVNKKEKKESQ